MRLITLGMFANFFKHSSLTASAVLPHLLGEFDMFQLGFISTLSIMISHPFEVARVLIVFDNDPKYRFGRVFGTIQDIYKKEGL